MAALVVVTQVRALLCHSAASERARSSCLWATCVARCDSLHARGGCSRRPLAHAHSALCGCAITLPQLNFRVQWYHLKDAFAEAGEVTYANVITGADGRSKGFGIVEFSNARDAQAAIGTWR